MVDCIYSYTVKDHARCNGFASDPVYSIQIQENLLSGSWAPPKSKKTGLCCLLFHQVLPIFTALLWLRLALLHTVCQSTRKAKWEPCTKTLPCSVVSARPGTPCPHFTSQTHNLCCCCCSVCVQSH